MEVYINKQIYSLFLLKTFKNKKKNLHLAFDVST